MDILLAFLGFAVGFLLYSVWQFMRSRHKAIRSARKAGTNVVASIDGSGEASEPRRALQRISAGQFMEVLAKTDDLVLIDLRPAHQNAPLPVRAPRVVRVQTNRLEDVLRHLPEDRSAVFYGASDLSVFMIMTSMYMRGSAPLYVLRPEPAHEDAA
jgi:hypothetical protein